jgi:hypothetical protein
MYLFQESNMPNLKSEAGMQIRHLLEWQEAAASEALSLRGRLEKKGLDAAETLIPFVSAMEACGVDVKHILEQWTSFWKVMREGMDAYDQNPPVQEPTVQDEGEAEALRAAWFSGMSGGNIEGEIVGDGEQKQ